MPVIPVGPAMGLSAEILRSARAFLGPSLERRAKRKANADELIHRRAQLAQELDENRWRNLERQYPLGTPGRLRAAVLDGIAPCLLVSPVVWVGAAPETVQYTVADRIRDLDPSSKLLQVFTGGFVRDSGDIRVIDGTVGAADVASHEFSPSPSMVVYFEQTAQAVTAVARLTNVIHTVDGERAITMRLARVMGGHVEIARWREPGTGSVDLEWVNGAVRFDSPLDTLRELGAAIAAFAVAICSLYWQLQGVSWSLPAERRTQGALPQVIGESAVRPVPPALGERLEQEVANLLAAGFEPEIVELPEMSVVGIYVHRNDEHSALFSIGSDYPQVPPEVLVRSDGGSVKQIFVSPAQWEPCQSLVSIAKAAL